MAILIKESLGIYIFNALIFWLKEKLKTEMNAGFCLYFGTFTQLKAV